MPSRRTPASVFGEGICQVQGTTHHGIAFHQQGQSRVRVLLRSIQIPPRLNVPIKKAQIAAHLAGPAAPAENLPVLKVRPLSYNGPLPFAKPLVRPRAGTGAKSRVVPKMRSGAGSKFRTVPKKRFGTGSKSGSKPWTVPKMRTKSGSKIGGVKHLTVPRMRTRTGSDSGFNSRTVPKLRMGMAFGNRRGQGRTRVVPQMRAPLFRQRRNTQQQSQPQPGILGSGPYRVTRIEKPSNPLSNPLALNSYICNKLQGKFQERLGQFELQCGPSAHGKLFSNNKRGSVYQLGSSGARKPLEHVLNFQQNIFRQLQEHLVDY